MCSQLLTTACPDSPFMVRTISTPAQSIVLESRTHRTSIKLILSLLSHVIFNPSREPSWECHPRCAHSKLAPCPICVSSYLGIERRLGKR